MKQIFEKQQVKHHEVFYFNSLYFLKMQLDFPDMIFPITIHYNLQLIHFFWSFQSIIFQFFWNNYCLPLEVNQFIGIFIHALIQVIQNQLISLCLLV
jgi:hypothetical protein